MRHFINIVEGYDPNASPLAAFFKAVGKHFEDGGQWFYDGECLTFAVAMHNVLAKFGIVGGLAFIMRGDESDDVLSHVVLQCNNDTFDSEGAQAYERWVATYNYNQHCNGDDGCEFWLDDVEGTIREVITDAFQFGVSFNPSLCQQIEEYALSLNPSF